MSDYHINIFYSSKDEGYIADIPDLAACSAFGQTSAEALEQLQIAKAAWLEAARGRKTDTTTSLSPSYLPGARSWPVDCCQQR